MTFLTIVERELRVRARHRGTYTVRLFAATGAFLIVAVLLLGHLAFGVGAGFGTTVFVTLAGLTFGFCLIEGARGTADSLSREKREGTLGLLFLTDLHGYEVVIGKLVASSINSVYGLLAILPALAIPLVLGGVTMGEFWRQVLALLNTLFLSLTVGLLVSTLSRDERETWVRTSLLVVVFAAVPPILELWPGWLSEGLAVISPFTAFLRSFDRAYAADDGRYWDSIRVVQGFSWFALVAASVLLPRVWQERPARSPGGMRVLSPSAQAAARRRRTRCLAINPALWLAARGDGPPLGLWLFTVAAGGVGLGGWLLAGTTRGVGVTLVMVFLIVHMALSVWVATEACHLGGAGRETGALELLLVTPLTTRQMVDGHLLALRRMFSGPVGVLVTMEVCVLAAHHWIVLDEPLAAGSLVWTAALLITVLAAVLELQAVATLGFWMGVSTRRPALAVIKTVAFVVVLPLLLFPCFPIYPLLAVGKNLAFTNYGHDQLRRHLRAILTGRFEDEGRGRRPVNRRERGQLPPVLD